MPRTHDWAVEQLADLFRTTVKVKMQQVVKIRGQNGGDIQLDAYLANTGGPVPLVLDLRITHDRWGRSADPTLNVHLHFPHDIDRLLNQDAAAKLESIVLTVIIILQMRSPLYLLLLVRLGGYIAS